MICSVLYLVLFFFFFFNDTATTEIYTLSLHDALPICLPKEERVRRARALLERLGLGSRLGNRPNQLSGGQQQRVSIARALMNGGQIILADEPTGALDSHSGAEVMTLLRELADAGHTIILITHDRSEE